MKFLSLVCLFAAISVKAQNVENIKLWNKDKPTFESHLSQKESVDERGFVTNVQEAEIFVFHPSESGNDNNRGKCVVICPGGAYYGVSLESEGKDFAKWLSEFGVTAVVLKYRMPNRVHQVPMEDVQKTFTIIQQNAQKWNVDTTKIGIMGFSAGGHLASTAAVKLNPAFAILFYPVISSQKDIQHKWSFDTLVGEDEKLRLEYSNEHHITPLSPKTLLFHCADDDAVSYKNSLVFAEKLTENKIFNQTIIFPTGGHGWGFAKNFRFHSEMKNILYNFINDL